MISEKLIAKHAPSTVGEQVHINHEDCSAGEDTKKRLYLKRVEKGILAYCHNCQESWFLRDKHTKKDRLSRYCDTDMSKLPSLPRNITKDIIDVVSPAGRMWLYQYYIDTDDILVNKFFKGIRYNTDQVALRLSDIEDNIIGWQIRNLDGKPPKYVSRFFNVEKGNSTWFHKKDNKKLVITEDYLSAYRIYRDTWGEYSTLALLKTSLSTAALEQIATTGFTIIYIWLDPDKAGKEGASKVYKMLSYFLPEDIKIKTITTNKEAKESSKEEIKGVLS